MHGKFVASAGTEHLTTIGMDADDTLWQSEQFFKLTEARFVELLAGYTEGADLSARLLQAEIKIWSSMASAPRVLFSR